jgi:hypothetical protein
MHTHERQRPGALRLGCAVLIASLAGCGHFKYDPYGTVGADAHPPPPSSARRQPAPLREVVDAVVVVKGPTVIGFFPPVNEADLDETPELGKALSEFTSALEAASDCLGPHGIAVRAAFADVLVAERDGRQTRLPLGEATPRIGFYLVDPDEEPQRVDASAASGSLPQMLGDAAVAYFHVPACVRPRPARSEEVLQVD